jgi:putative DNA primase/helicase
MNKPETAAEIVADIDQMVAEVLSDIDPSAELTYRAPDRRTDYSDDAVNRRKLESSSPSSWAAWPKLDPLPDAAASKPKAFPFDALGSVLGLAALAIHRDVQVPDAVAAGSVLAAASLAAQPHADIVMPHGQCAPLSLFIATGAHSGERKSAADQIVQREVEEVRREQARKYQAERAAAHGDKEAPKTNARSLTIGKATVEGLQMILGHQSHVGLFSAEGGEMLGGHSLREERRSAGLAWLLKAWGGETLDALTRSDGLSILLGRRVALHVMVQPVLLRALLSDPLAQGQGLLARCLIAQPESLAGTRMFRDTDPSASHEVQAFHGHMRELLRRPPNLMDGGDGCELRPRALPMSAEARALWIEFHDAIERAQGPGGDLEHARAFASKAPEHAARIAGVVQMVSSPDAVTLSAEAMHCGMAATDFYIGEHVRLTGAGIADRHAARLRMLVEWMGGRGASVLHKDVLQRAPRPVRDLKAESIGRLLDELAQRHYIRRIGEAWEVNPHA